MGFPSDIETVNNTNPNKASTLNHFICIFLLGQMEALDNIVEGSLYFIFTCDFHVGYYWLVVNLSMTRANFLRVKSLFCVKI